MVQQKRGASVCKTLASATHHKPRKVCRRRPVDARRGRRGRRSRGEVDGSARSLLTSRISTKTKLTCPSGAKLPAPAGAKDCRLRSRCRGRPASRSWKFVAPGGRRQAPTVAGRWPPTQYRRQGLRNAGAEVDRVRYDALLEAAGLRRARPAGNPGQLAAGGSGVDSDVEALGRRGASGRHRRRDGASGVRKRACARRVAACPSAAARSRAPRRRRFRQCRAENFLARSPLGGGARAPRFRDGGGLPVIPRGANIGLSASRFDRSGQSITAAGQRRLTPRRHRGRRFGIRYDS